MIILLLAGLVLALWVPGYAVMVAAGWRSFPAVVAAPAISVALAGGGAIIAGRLGLGWSAMTFAGVSTFAVLIAWAARKLLGGAGYAPELNGNPRSNLLLLGGLLVGAAVQAVAIVPGMRRLDMPVQNRDAVFHMNAVQGILETGDASTFGGLAPMYGGDIAPTYPAAWHGVVALVAGPLTVVEVSNLLAILVSVVVYPSGVALLARSLAGPRSWAGPVAPVIAGGATVFPPAVMFFHGQWPFGLSLALLPAVVALAVSADKRSWTALITVLVGAVGAVLAHPSTAGIFVVMLAAAAASRGFAWGLNTIKAGAPWRGAFILAADVAAIFAATAVSALLASRTGMAGFSRPSSGRFEALVEALTLRTVGPYEWSQTASNWVAFALLLVGIFVVVKARKNLWLVLTWAVFVVLTAVAVGPDGTLRSLTALWYKDDLRMRAILTIFVVLLCSMGLAWIVQTLGSRVKGVRNGVAEAAVAAAILFALALTTAAGHRALRIQQWIGGGYQPQFMVAPPLADVPELELIRSLDGILPEDAVVVGDPLSGAVLVQAMIGRSALIPVIGDSGLGVDQKLILSRFADISQYPEVCDALDREGGPAGNIYLYWDPEVRAFLGAVPPAEGFVDVSAVPNLELVASSGDVRVWRVGACE